MTKKPNQITFLDFFAGIGGFRTAVERLGGKCLGFAEIDKHARQSYKALYNTEGEREWHDITQVKDHEFAGVSNSQRYKQAGNSVTVNAIEAIVTQLIALDRTNQNESTEVA